MVERKESYKATVDGPTLMGIAAVVTSLGNLAFALSPRETAKAVVDVFPCRTDPMPALPAAAS